jgi:hypothetical protein
MTIGKGILSALLLVSGLPAAANAAELQQATLRAWNDYVRQADGRMRNRLSAGRPFLWSDESPDRKTRVRQGEVMVSPMVGRGTQDAPNGLIHDWIGASFIPKARIETLMAVFHDYDRYKEVYKPVVADSRAIACTPTDQEFAMTWRRHVLFVNAALEGQYRGHDFAVDERRGYNIADTTQMREIENYGTAGERFLPPGTGNGFIWRLHSIARYEERDGGLYVELEVIALTRDIPASLRWLVSPVVNHLSISSLTTTLRQTQQAMHALPPEQERVALCTGRGHSDVAVKRGGED